MTSQAQRGPTHPRHGRSLATTVLINVASILEKCDEQILPAVYAYVGASFSATPAELGNITLARALMQALASPLGGISSQFQPRGRIIGVGCILWASMTALFATTHSILWALPVVSVNGIGLSLVIPNVQSLTADFHKSSSRGRAFGRLWLTLSMGGMLGALYATNMGARRPFGFEGWRFVFVSVACVSALTGLLNILFVHDPTFTRDARSANKLDAAMARSMWRDMSFVLRIPTFCLIIAQGIVGTVPSASLVFFTLYLQLSGMSNAAASALVALLLAGGGLGGLLGGYVGDRAAKLSANHGRILATQLSVGLGVPGAILIFKYLPMDGEPRTIALYAVAILAFALLTSWPAPCCNNPVFAEIVPDHLRNLVYSFDRCFEGAIAACAAPLVGLLAERYFGFKGSTAITGVRKQDLANAVALGNALLAFLVVPWTLCFFTYTGLHWTYPADRRAALAVQRRLAEEEQSPDEEEEGLCGREEGQGSQEGAGASSSNGGEASERTPLTNANSHSRPSFS